MNIRTWRKEDIPTIVELEKICFSDPWTREEIESCLNFDFYKTFLIEEQGEIVGYACGTVLFEDAELLNIAISPNHRKKGYGKRLLEELLGFVKGLGAEKIFLEVRASNLSAKGLYEAFGFQPMGVRKHYYADGEDAVVMTKKL